VSHHCFRSDPRRRVQVQHPRDQVFECWTDLQPVTGTSTGTSTAATTAVAGTGTGFSAGDR
jgi:hypothetical protein